MKKIFLLLTLGIIFAFSAFGVVEASTETITIGDDISDLTAEPIMSDSDTLTAWYGTLNIIDIDITTIDGEFDVVWTGTPRTLAMGLYNGHITDIVGLTHLSYAEIGTFGSGNEKKQEYNISGLNGNTDYTIVLYDTSNNTTIIYLQFTTLSAPYNITYNLDGGNNHIDNPTSFVAGDTPITLLDPTPPVGYNFIDWHDAETLDSPITTINVEDDIELWAEYELIPPPPSMPELIFGAMAEIVTSVVAIFTTLFSQDGIMSIFWTTENGLSFVGTLSLLLFGFALVRIGMNFIKRMLEFKD